VFVVVTLIWLPWQMPYLGAGLEKLRSWRSRPPG
jgi:hypothetical protein